MYWNVMRTRLLALAMGTTLAACGGSDSGGGGGSSLNPAFGGTWTGVTTVTVTGLSPFTFPSTLGIAVSGSTATINNVCPDGSGTIVGQGSGNTVSWSGTLTCPPVAVAGVCPAVTATYTSATATLNDNGTLTSAAAATASGCLLTSPATLTFTGSK